MAIVVVFATGEPGMTAAAGTPTTTTTTTTHRRAERRRRGEKGRRTSAATATAAATLAGRGRTAPLLDLSLPVWRADAIEDLAAPVSEGVSELERVAVLIAARVTRRALRDVRAHVVQPATSQFLRDGQVLQTRRCTGRETAVGFGAAIVEAQVGQPSGVQEPLRS